MLVWLFSSRHQGRRPNRWVRGWALGASGGFGDTIEKLQCSARSLHRSFRQKTALQFSVCCSAARGRCTAVSGKKLQCSFLLLRFIGVKCQKLQCSFLLGCIFSRKTAMQFSFAALHFLPGFASDCISPLSVPGFAPTRPARSPRTHNAQITQTGYGCVPEN